MIAGLLRRAVLVLACAAIGVAAPARGDDIEVRDLALRAAEQGLVLDADFGFELSPRLVDMVSNWVPLYFTVEFEIIWKSAIDVGWIWLWMERVTGFGPPRPTRAVDWTVTRSDPGGGGEMRSE